MKKALKGLLIAFMFYNVSASPLDDIKDLYRCGGIHLVGTPSEARIETPSVNELWFKRLQTALSKLNLSDVPSSLLLALGRTLQYDIISKMSTIVWKDEDYYQTTRIFLRNFGTKCFIIIFKQKESAPEHKEATMLLDYLIEEEFEILEDASLEERILEKYAEYSSTSSSPRSEDFE